MKRFLFLLLCLLAPRAQAAGNVLFVDNNGSGATAQDASMVSRLSGTLGYTVTVIGGAAVTTADATGKDLVFISESVGSVDVNTKFRDVAVPVVVSEAYLFDDMNFTGSTSSTDFEYDVAQTQLHIINSAHYLAAGYSNTITVYSAARDFNWGIPAASAIRVANVAGIPAHLAIFAYDTGLVMMNSQVAPARRVGFYIEENAAGSLSSTGWDLFDRAILWAHGAAPATPTFTFTLSPSPTRTPSPTPTRTPSATFSPTATPLFSLTSTPSLTKTLTPGPTASVTPTPGGWSVTARLYSSNGQLVRSAVLPGSGFAISSAEALPQPWDPLAGGLALSSGSWAALLSGVDDQGQLLFNGPYVLVLGSKDAVGAPAPELSLKIVVLGSGPPALSSALAAPNPALIGQAFLDIFWAPSSAAPFVQVYELNGQKVADAVAIAPGQARWELGSAANGVYLVVLRLEGQRQPLILKAALAR